MRKAEIDALVRAHRGRARPVAFFYVLRQPALEPDDHAFLSEHIDELGASDLLRWRARCASGLTGPILQQLARMAIEDPAHFQHEVLDVPRLEMEEQEWIDLADLVRGKIPPPIYARVLERGERKPVKRASEFFFTPGVIKTSLASFLDGELADTLDPSLPPEDLKRLSMTRLLAARRAGRLALDDAAFLKLALERASHTEEDWSFGVLEFPELLRDAILEKARRTPRAAERANLLAWLEANGVPRGTLIDVALAPIRRGETSYPILSWLARQLATVAAWDEHGWETLAALLDQRAFPEISELIAMTWSEAGRGGDVPRGLLEAMQGAFALALIGLAREKLATNDPRGATAALSALACLDPPPRVSRAVHELRRMAGADGEVLELIAVNERLANHSDARDASLEGVVAALHAIADAFG